MRKRFEQQLKMGQIPISETEINPDSQNALDQLLAALKEIFCDEEYNEKIFNILETELFQTNSKNGRPGMDLWVIFVLAQVRLGTNASYNTLHNQANNHHLLHCILGIEQEMSFGRIEYEYQNIHDNVSLLTDDMLHKINDIIVDFGHKKVFSKKKEEIPLRLKSDSFVIESNVHFPTDYNLLWDCARVCLRLTDKLLKRHPGITGWRKRKSWGADLKAQMREVSRKSAGGGKNKEKLLKEVTQKYVTKSILLCFKLNELMSFIPINETKDLELLVSLEYFLGFLKKHIDLVERRIIKGEEIPHEEKMFSIFETYTEWITKGKLRPNVELGKKVAIDRKSVV